MKSITTTACTVIIARCDAGEDLYESLAMLVQKHEILSGHFQVMGAVGRAKVGIFEGGRYSWITHEGALEISACIGNVALKEGRPFVHCHAVFTDQHGTVVAGHVGEGCIISPTAEIHLTVHDCRVERFLDTKTNLWMLNP